MQFTQPSLIITMHPNAFAAVNYLPSEPILNMNITRFNNLAYREGLNSCRSSCMRCKIGICHATSVLNVPVGPVAAAVARAVKGDALKEKGRQKVPVRGICTHWIPGGSLGIIGLPQC